MAAHQNQFILYITCLYTHHQKLNRKRKQEVLQDVLIKFAGDCGDNMQFTGSHITNNTVLSRANYGYCPDSTVQVF